MEELDIKTAIQIAKILAAAPDERIPMILDVFSKAQVDINGLDELAEWRALDKQAALIDTDTFVTELTKGKELEDGEYRIRVPEFNHFCSTKGVSARYARKHHRLAEYIETKIAEDGYSPGAVLGEIKAKGLEFETEISKPTLYSYIDKGIFLTITNKELPVKGRRKKKNKKVRRQARANAGTSIEKRPEDIDTREEFGHWEMDTVVGKRGESKHSLLVLTERKTRNELIYLLYEHTTEQVCKRLDQLEAEWGEQFGQVFKTITVDNGSEFADWKGMQQSAADESEKRVTVFYCHPYCSFERGSNENQNRLVRRKIPKGENFDDRTEDDIQRVEDWINDYPREMFGWKTSGELFQEELARLA